MAGAVFLEGENIELRTLEAEDAEFLRDLNHRTGIRRYLGRVPRPSSVKEEEERIEEITESDDIIQFIITQDGERSGTIALFDINETYRNCEVGAIMVEPESQGEGIGSEALETIIEYAFSDLNMHRVVGGYIEDNEASRRIQEKLGFTEEGVERDWVYRDGEYKDIVRTSLLEDEWGSQ